MTYPTTFHLDIVMRNIATIEDAWGVRITGPFTDLSTRTGEFHIAGKTRSKVYRYDDFNRADFERVLQAAYV